MKQALLLLVVFLSVLSCQKKMEKPSYQQPGINTLSRSIISNRRGVPGEATCGQLRTQSPGGWGTQPQGNNPGTYLYANFDNAFPSGLTVGCSPDYNLTLNSASAVSDFLPSGGKAQALTMNYIDPTGLKNVLAGHLVALTISVAFDDSDVTFGEAGITLGAMNIKDGAFEGWNVYDFLIEANQVLGGCSQQFTVQQVLETASKINENYVDGKTDKEYLVCPN